MPAYRRKKKSVTDEQAVPLQKITVENQPATPKNNVEAGTKEQVPPTPPVVKKSYIESKKTNAPEQAASKLQQRPISISISKQNNVASPQEEYETKRATGPVFDKQFSDEDLKKLWIAFTNTIPDEIRMVSYMQNNIPQRIADSTFEIYISNSLQEKEINRLKPDILTFLRTQLSNSSIEIVVKMNETVQTQKYLSPEDKYKQMAMQNPALVKLRSGLQFEVD